MKSEKLVKAVAATNLQLREYLSYSEYVDVCRRSRGIYVTYSHHHLAGNSQTFDGGGFFSVLAAPDELVVENEAGFSLTSFPEPIQSLLRGNVYRSSSDGEVFQELDRILAEQHDRWWKSVPGCQGVLAVSWPLGLPEAEKAISDDVQIYLNHEVLVETRELQALVL